ncbi:MAG: hypothetical protein ACLP1X_11010 [Polyangiaceae bacterium]|jgi:hypothetical protein
MPEIGLSGSMRRGPGTEQWQTYTGTKPETADTDNASLHATTPFCLAGVANLPPEYLTIPSPNIGPMRSFT